MGVIFAEVSCCHSNHLIHLLVSAQTVKAAKKLKSCLCCIPGEGDEEEDEDEDGEDEDGERSKPKDGMDLSMPGAFATGRSKYVDGKTQFAFDPTMFSK